MMKRKIRMTGLDMKQLKEGGGGGHNPHDIFENIFGGMGGRRHREEERPDTDIKELLEIDLEDVYTGKKVKRTVEYRKMCC